MLLILLCGSSLLYYIERDTNDSINTYYDSLWWSIVTLTTVGYGDIYPTTNAGRTVASILMFIGLGIIASITATIASFLIEDEASDNEMITLLRNIDIQLTELNRKLKS